MSSTSASTSEEAEALRRERLESHRKVWRWFLYLGWPAALFSMWLGGRIAAGLADRARALEAENLRLKSAAADVVK